MNEIAINALIERLLFHAACHGSVAQFDDEQKQWAEDLFAAADLIRNLSAARSGVGGRWPTVCGRAE